VANQPFQVIDFIGSSGRTRTYNPSVNSRPEATGVPVFSVTYAEPNGVFGADSALSFPNFFPKFSAGSVSLAVEEQARIARAVPGRM
jgi:hypothetical protein